jgi:Fe-Mn family superoxide dismutase
MAFELPPLPWSKDALAPHISPETIDYHYGKHHAGYVKKLNALTEGKPEAEKSLEELIRTADGGVFNNAAQIWNHTFYWKSMRPNGGGTPSGDLLSAIERDFGSFDAFKEAFKSTGLGRFGSGYVWLVLDGEKLVVRDTLNAGNPLTDGQVPLLTADLWEHAYYIDHRNDRGGYLDAFLGHLANWDFAAENLAGAR